MTIIFDGTNGITSPGGDTANTSYTTPIVKSPSSLTLQTNGSTTAVTIDTSQNVGVGTISPNTRLQASVGSNGSGVVNTLRLQNVGTTAGDGAKIVFTAGASTDGAGIASTGVALNSADLRFYTGGNTERMTIDTVGRVRMPFQPMFSGHRNNGNISAGSVVIINTPDIDVGNNYNYSNGRFTCPITGVYEVHTCGHSENSQPAQLSILKNGTTVKREYQNGAAYGTTPVTIIMNCSAGDYIEVYVQTGAYWGSDITGVRLTVKLVA